MSRLVMFAFADNPWSGLSTGLLLSHNVILLLAFLPHFLLSLLLHIYLHFPSFILLFPL